MPARAFRNERGAALLETAITLPIILMICVGIFEFGRAYQTWQVLTNAAREGARVAVLSGTTDLEVETAVRNYMATERLENAGTAPIAVDRRSPSARTPAPRSRSTTRSISSCSTRQCGSSGRHPPLAPR